VSRRGRRRRDWIALFEEIGELRRVEPGISANRVQRRVGANRDAVRRICKVLKVAEDRRDA